MSKLTPAELAEIRGREKAATQGPWGHGVGVCGPYLDYQAHPDERGGPEPMSDYNGRQPVWLGGDVREEDRAFAAHARTGYPAALLALKAAMEQIEGMKQWGLALAIIAANEPIGSSAHTIAMEGISKAAAHAKAGKTQEVPNE